VLVSVEQDNGVTQDVDSISIPEQVRALLVVVLAKALHDAIDFLRLPRQSEGLQIEADRHVEGQACRGESQDGQSPFLFLYYLMFWASPGDWKVSKYRPIALLKDRPAELNHRVIKLPFLLLYYLIFWASPGSRKDSR
jgi:hypothetical protein